MEINKTENINPLFQHGGLGYSWMPYLKGKPTRNAFIYTYPNKPFDEFKCETDGCRNLVNNIKTKTKQNKICDECIKQRRKDRQLSRYYRKKMDKEMIPA